MILRYSASNQHFLESEEIRFITSRFDEEIFPVMPLVRRKVLTPETLVEQAKNSAPRHVVGIRPHGAISLKKRLKIHKKSLRKSFFILSSSLEEEKLNSGSEWIIDNYHVLEQHIKTIDNYLLVTKTKELPQLLEGPYIGFPRIWAIAYELVKYSEASFDDELLKRYVSSYQSKISLTMEELWAFPEMLRLVLIEKLAHLATFNVLVRKQRAMADHLLDRVFSNKKYSPSETVIACAKFFEKRPEYWSYGCLVHLILELRNLGSKGSLCLKWLHQKIEEHGFLAETLVEQVLFVDSSIQILISNIFAAFRTIATYDWTGWFEEVSHVHKVLMEDSVYLQCDAQTCAHYRNKIGKLAKRVELEEKDIAKKAISLCSSSEEAARAGVGYFLIGDGVTELEKMLGYRPTVWENVGRYLEKRAFRYWLIGCLISLLGFLVIPYVWLYEKGYGGTEILLLIVPFFIIASEGSIELLQWLLGHLKEPKFLPRLNFEQGVPESCTTLVVLHIVLSCRNGIEEAINSLEGQMISNRDPHLHFALACDRIAAGEAEIAEDFPLIDYADELVSNVNQRWEGKLPSKVFLITRERFWNASEERFLCWERKRGKLHQLNQLILGKDVPGMHMNVGDPELLRKVRYVITIDEDVKIPPDAAYRIVGTIAHPLNHAIVDDEKRVIKKGYAIVQPLIKTAMKKACRTPLTRIFSESPGTDPYTYLVSSMHQDLFLEGVYVGKGIYDVKAFEEVLKDRFPENAILSHDLIEGLFARVGLSTDLYLLEDIPETYTHFSQRLHRWMRGDWQLLPWLFPRIPSAKGERVPTTLSPWGRWKILENLRRSFLFPAVFIAIIFTWLLFHLFHAQWLAYIFLVMNFSIVTSFIDLIYLPIKNIRSPWASIYHGWQSLKNHLQQAIVRILLVPPITALSLHAMGVSLYRLFFSKKRFLQWNTFSEVQRNSSESLSSLTKKMASGLCLTAIVFAGLFLLPTVDFYIAFPLVIAWFCTPFIAKYLGTPYRRKGMSLSSSEKEYLVRVAWHTWHYYADLLSEKGHYLMPDNLQIVPKPTVAMRTSPTNIGFQFLSALSAYDFGFLHPKDLIFLYCKALDSIETLEKEHGHLYNWYNTETLQPLHPRYVSSVDSGNFISHLLVARFALQEIHNSEILPAAHWEHFKRCIHIVQAHWRVAPLTLTPPKYVADFLHLFHALEEWIHSVVHTTRTVHASVSTHDETITQRAITDILKFAEIGSTFRFMEIFEVLLEKLDHLPVLDLEVEIKLLAEELHKGYRQLTRLHSPTWTSFLYEAKQLSELIGELKKFFKEKPNLPEIQEVLETSENLAEELSSLAKWCEQFLEDSERAIAAMTSLIRETDFRFLYSKREKLLSIGFHEEKGYLDPNYYAFLASESCISSLVAIAKGDIPSKHWFALGRPLIRSSAGKTLLSWSGSAFEYLMPLILIKPLENSLLDVMTTVVAKAQRNYGRKHRLPWGISESGYGVTDREGNYQYKAFGLPELGLKRGLGDDYVVSPYSTFLTLQLLLKEAVMNIHDLEQIGARGTYGFFEAIDYTPSRLGEEETGYILRSYLTHHQGMILNSINNVINDGILQKRFQSAPMIRSFDLLLQEQFPYGFGTVTLTREHPGRLKQLPEEELISNVIDTPHTRFPCTHVLSNGHLSEMIDNTGGGYLFFEDQIALTRWSPDPLFRHNGYHIFVRDLESGDVWSAGYQPTRVEAKKYEWICSPHKIEVRRSDHDISLHMEATISPEDNLEYRHITLTNLSRRKREIDITTYGEVVLTTLGADQFHLPFSKMFIESFYSASDVPGLIFRRVPRSSHDKELYLMHMHLLPVCWDKPQWETDRYRFIGRGRTIHNPQAMEGPLSNTTGFTLDPIFSLRGKILLKPHESVSLTLVTGIGRSREEIDRLMEAVCAPKAVQRAFEISLAHSQISTRYEHLTAHKVRVYQAFAQSIFFPLDPYREGKESRSRNKLQQGDLWALGISGDFPIILIRLADENQVAFLQDLLSAHNFLARKQVHFDVVIIDEVEEGYRDDFFKEIESLCLRYDPTQTKNSSNGVVGRLFLFNAAHLQPEQILLLEAYAHRIFTEQEESLLLDVGKAIKPLPISRKKKLLQSQIFSTAETEFFNGYGGFIDAGKGYRFFIQPGVTTPRPWVNVIGNENFGFLISETGGGYTWSENSQQNHLSPLHADPVTDSRGEMLYLRHPQTRAYCALFPTPEQGSAIAEHHFGYSRFVSSVKNIDYEVIVSGARHQAVKWWRLTFFNRSSMEQEIELFLYIEWVLGVLRQESQQHLLCGYDRLLNYIFAKNPVNGPFRSRLAFMGTSEPVTSFTTSREGFFGENRDPFHPKALETEEAYVKLDKKISTGSDSCGVMHLLLQLEPRQEKEVLFYIAEAENSEEASRAAIHYSSPLRWKEEWEKVNTFWRETTDTIQVSTPERSFDILMNGWLLYQTISCRLWARTGFFQSSGAYGFRDQLQDALALLPIDSYTTRRQILLHASRQFREGDVQHWWNPPLGSGVRTRISDDLLWLPFAVIQYLQATGDKTILEEEVGFLEGDLLKDEEHEAYGTPRQIAETASVYHHCVLAIDHAMRFGAHGLPLMGSGDWNDGMNAVGIDGKGESIWLGWFLYTILKQFENIAREREDNVRVEHYHKMKETLLQAIEKEGWDGEWYRRAYFDDGTPLGSQQNDECQIDSISQTWSIISGAAEEDRQEKALTSVYSHLVSRDARLIQLLAPPFDHTHLEPGYIKAYPPGIRENGGQYTHAATWVVLASALRGWGTKAFELFQMINPITHTLNQEDADRYEGEPYVLAGDVYSRPPFTGVAGWTWYTGSAGWLYHVGVTAILGLRVHGDFFTLSPCIPKNWKDYRITYRWKRVVFSIHVMNPHGRESSVEQVKVDGKEMPDKRICFPQDVKGEKVIVNVEVVMGP